MRLPLLAYPHKQKQCGCLQPSPSAAPRHGARGTFLRTSGSKAASSFTAHFNFRAKLKSVLLCIIAPSEIEVVWFGCCKKNDISAGPLPPLHRSLIQKSPKRITTTCSGPKTIFGQMNQQVQSKPTSRFTLVEFGWYRFKSTSSAFHRGPKPGNRHRGVKERIRSGHNSSDSKYLNVCD